MFSKVFGDISNILRRIPQHDSASTSSSQQESTSGSNSSQYQDEFNTVNVQNSGNLLIEDTRHKFNRTLASSVDIYSKDRMQSQMKHALDAWEKSGTRGEDRRTAKKRILQFMERRFHRLELTNLNLKSLPEEIGNLTEVRELKLWGNQLTTLPDSIGNLTGLQNLNVSGNQVTALPPGIFRLPNRTRVNLERNRLSSQTIDTLTRQTNGPRINFSIVEAPADPTPGRSRSFENAIKHYCSDVKPKHLQNLLGSENAVYFGQLLNRLDGTTGPIASAEASLPGFADRVATVISTLAEVDNAELRANCFLQAQQGLETCGDRVAITFADIEIACKAQRILQSGGGDQQMAQLLTGMFRLSTLDAFARSDIASRQGGIDDIEIFLAYRVGLKDELALPCETGAMLYNEISGVDQDALNRAKVHVITTETADNSAALVNFAIEQPFWNLHMEKNQRFQKEKQEVEATFQKLSEDLEERAETMSDQQYTQEYNTMAANRDAKLKEVQREFTSEIIRRF